MEQMACRQEQVAAGTLAMEHLARQAQEDNIETIKAENGEHVMAEQAQMMNAAAENGSVSSNQPFSILDPLEIREETEEEKKARLEMEEEVKKMLENLPPYVKRVVRTIKPLDESLHCKECDVWVNSDTQMKQHLGSLRHKNTIAGVPVPPRPDKIEPVKPRSNHQYKCELCHVTLNSEVQLLQHLRSHTQGNFGRKTAKAEMGAVRAIPRAATNPGKNQITIRVRCSVSADPGPELHAHGADGAARARAVANGSNAKCPKRTGNDTSPRNAVCPADVNSTQ